MKRHGAAILTLALLLASLPALAVGEKVDKRQAKREAIDGMARAALERLLTENEGANQLAGRAVGYAVFDSFKAAFVISGGGGVGVAVNSETGKRTYMKMGTGGIGLGIGGQSYQVVFVFENQEVFDRFVKRGWQADAAANAAAGTSGKNFDASFSHGLTVFQLTNRGLLAQADVSGTKYWKMKKLNRRP